MERIIENSIDVRVIEPKYKHMRIFERFDELNKGESLLIINDHDPKPLYYQLLAERGNIFNWTYLLNGPDEWRVDIELRTTDTEESVGEIAAKDIKKVAIFKKYGIDFCCGGKKTLSQVCVEKGIDVKVVEFELEATEPQFNNVENNFNDFPLDILCDYIENTHHDYVKSVLPTLLEISNKVSNKHGGRDPELFRINELVHFVNNELMLHMKKEEVILFPFIRSLVNDKKITITKEMLEGPIHMMEIEHESVGEKFTEIAILTNHFTPPATACASYLMLYKTLKEFEEDLHLHIHLENNILFPKALNQIF